MDLLIKSETLISMQAEAAAALPLAEQSSSMLGACCNAAWQSEALCEHSVSTRCCALILQVSLLPTRVKFTLHNCSSSRCLCCRFMKPLIEGEAFIDMATGNDCWCTPLSHQYLSRLVKGAYREGAGAPVWACRE